MFNCPKCGKQLPDGASFCMDCGADVRHVESVTVVEPASPRRTRLNVLAIVGLGLCFMGLPGIIVSACALKNADYEHYRTPLKPLAVTGLALGIFFTIFWICYAAFFTLFFARLFGRVFDEVLHINNALHSSAFLGGLL